MLRLRSHGAGGGHVDVPVPVEALRHLASERRAAEV